MAKPEKSKMAPVSSRTTTPIPLSAPPARETSSLSDDGAETREGKISEAAFFKAALRGFVPGHDWEDWFAAEKEVDAQSTGTAPPTGNGSGALQPDPNSRIWSS